MGLELPIDITSVFRDEGFKNAQKRMEQFEKAGFNLDMTVDELNQRMEGLGVAFDEGEDKWRDSKGQFASMSQVVGELKSEKGALAAMAQRTGRDVEDLNDILDRTNFSLKQAGKDGAVKFKDELTGSMEESRKAAQEANRQMQTFRFDMLSLMFAGMELSRVFKGLLKPAMESFGVFDLISDVLTIFFLPAAGMVMDAVMKIAGFFLDLPDPIQKAINVFAIAAVVIGAVTKAATILFMNLAPIGQVVATVTNAIMGSKGLTAALGGLKTWLGKSVMGKALLAFGSFLLTPVGAIAAIVGAIAGLALAWKNNWFDIRQRTGKAIQFIGDKLMNLIEFAEPVLDAYDAVFSQLNRIPGIDIGDSPLTDGLEAATSRMKELGAAAEEQGEKINKAQNTAEDTDVSDDGFVSGAIGGDGFSPLGSDQGGDGMTINDIDSEVNVDGANVNDEAELADQITSRQEEMFSSGLQGR